MSATRGGEGPLIGSPGPSAARSGRSARCKPVACKHLASPPRYNRRGHSSGSIRSGRTAPRFHLSRPEPPLGNLPADADSERVPCRYPCPAFRTRTCSTACLPAFSAVATNASCASCNAPSSRSTRSKRRCRSSPTSNCRPRLPSSRSASPMASRWTRSFRRRSRSVREASQRVLGHAPLRRPAHGRRGAAPRQHRRDAAPVRARRSSPRLPAYLNALHGKGVHVVTVNDYLAEPRRPSCMGRVYSCARPERRRASCPGMTARRRAASRTPPTSPTAPTTSSASTTCATTWRCRRTTDWSSAASTYAIVDEVDSILIDEARTPLIISGPADESPELYIKVNRLVPRVRAVSATD